MLAKTPVSARRAEALHVLRTVPFKHVPCATYCPDEGYCALQFLCQHFGYAHRAWRACAVKELGIPTEDGTLSRILSLNDNGASLRTITTYLEHLFHHLDKEDLEQEQAPTV